MPDPANPWARAVSAPARPRFGRLAVAVGALLGVALAAYPAWVRVTAGEQKLLFPITWALECGLAAGFAAAGLAVAKGPWAFAERRLFRATLGSFGLGYALLLVCGFDWTGDWMRFAAFQAGLRTERLIAGAGPADWRVYTWRSWGFAGLENDSYLVADPSGRLASLPASGVLPGVACPIAEDRPLVLPWHLVVTANCVLVRPRGAGAKLDI